MPPLVTERLLLRPFLDDDLDALHAMQRHPEVVRYLDWPPMSREQARSLLDRIMPMTAIGDGGDALRLAAILPDSGALVGDFSLWRASREASEAEIGFVVDPAFQGRGYGTEAATALLRLGFEELGFHRIVGRCDSRNTASARLMERLGMRREAEFRQSAFIKGEWTDELVYAMLADEWRTGR